MKTVYNSAVIQLPLFAVKVCNRCGIEKFLLDFSTNPSSKDGRKSICKVCDYATTKARKEANPEYYKEQARASQTRCKERIRAYNRRNAERKNRRNRERFANDPEYRRHHKEYHSLYVSSHRDQANAWARKWREANPLKNTEYAMSYKARKEGVTVEDVDYQQILEQSDGICYICEKAILPHHKIEFDHVIPITRDGIHAASNIKVTHNVCNSRKHNFLFEELSPWLRRGPDA